MVAWLLADFKIAYQASKLMLVEKRLTEIEKARPKGNGGGTFPLPCFIKTRSWPLHELTDVSHTNEKFDYSLYCQR